MQETQNSKKWVVLEGFKIFDNSLWRQTDPKNPLSELVEESVLDPLGKGDGYIIYVCEQPPKEIKELVLELGFDTHLYLGVSETDIEQKAVLWPY